MFCAASHNNLHANIKAKMSKLKIDQGVQSWAKAEAEEGKIAM